MTALTPGAVPSSAGVAQRHPVPSTSLAANRAWTLAGPGPVSLAESYQICRSLNAAHGRTYFFATRFLPRSARPHVHALYAFARYADDLVDHTALPWGPQARRNALENWSSGFLDDLDRGHSADPVLKAVVHTVHTLGLPREDLEAFLASMAMDLTVRRYETYADLRAYVHGSAAVIGTMMLPVLGSVDPEARARAMDLGIAFQLTNFLRDVAEDWERGRLYIPLEDLDRFGVAEADFGQGRVTPAMRRLLGFQAARARERYARARAGWGMLEPRSRTCIRIAHRLYAEILDRLELGGWPIFDRPPVVVPTRRKLAVAAREIVAPSRPRLPLRQ